MPMHRSALRTLWTFSLSTLLLGCGGSFSEPSPSSNLGQVVAMSINTPNSSVPPTIQALDAAVGLAQGANVRGVIATYTWSSLEPTPGQVDVSSLKSGLSYYHQKGLQILLGIQVINTVKREVPTDLENTAFDDPQFISRFHSLLDAVRGALSGGEQYISVGNEVDVYLAQTNEWAAYTSFYQDAISYLHAKSPGLKVGVTATFSGYSGNVSSEVNALNGQSDVIILTYYPLQGDSQVLAPTSPLTDLPQMLDLAGGKPIVLQEAGYPSGALNGSSETFQQEFVTNLFKAWRGAGNRLPFLSYFLLYDFDTSTCNALGAYYGSADPAFLSYLCTLGLRNADGSEKLAWGAFVSAAH
jgi:hypothetical protein